MAAAHARRTPVVLLAHRGLSNPAQYLGLMAYRERHINASYKKAKEAGDS